MKTFWRRIYSSILLLLICLLPICFGGCGPSSGYPYSHFYGPYWGGYWGDPVVISHRPWRAHEFGDPGRFAFNHGFHGGLHGQGGSR